MSATPAYQDKVVEFVKTIVSALGLVLIIHSLVVKPFVIPSPSMVPTLLVGDYLFVSKFTYGYSRYSFPLSPNLFSGRVLGGKPERGDVIVFRPTKTPDIDWIKRVIGLPGDRIQIIKGILHINGEAVTLEKVAPYHWKDEKGNHYDSDLYYETLPNGVKHKILKTDAFGEGRGDDTREFIVPKDHYFMMGDNRDHSSDSRFPGLGYVPYQNLVGRAEIIFFSTSLPTDDGAWWMVWRWPTATRYLRFFNIIR